MTPILNAVLRGPRAVNDAIAVRANQVFASMGFFWFCLALTLVPLRWPALMPFVQYTSSGVLQLVALPLIGVGTILVARSSDRQSKEQHDAAIEMLADVRQLTLELHEMHSELHTTLTLKKEL